MAENERCAKPTFGHFIKTLREAVDLGQISLKQACKIFFW